MRRIFSNFVCFSQKVRTLMKSEQKIEFHLAPSFSKFNRKDINAQKPKTTRKSHRKLMCFRLNFKDEEAKIEEKHSPSKPKVLWLLIAEMKKRVPYRNLDNSSVNTLSSRVVWYIPSSQWIGICRRKSWIFQNVKVFLNFRSSFCPVGLCSGSELMG